MNRNELRKADINLMVVFETLMLERNVTRVAERLFLGQPAEIGRTRHVVLSVPQYSSLPALLAGTDLIASLPDYTAEAMAASGQLFKEPFPFETPTLDLSMVWLSHVDSDPAERWLRSRLEAFMSERATFPLSQ